MSWLKTIKVSLVHIPQQDARYSDEIKKYLFYCIFFADASKNNMVGPAIFYKTLFTVQDRSKV